MTWSFWGVSCPSLQGYCKSAEITDAHNSCKLSVGAGSINSSFNAFVTNALPVEPSPHFFFFKNCVFQQFCVRDLWFLFGPIFLTTPLKLNHILIILSHNHKVVVLDFITIIKIFWLVDGAFLIENMRFYKTKVHESSA